MFVTGNEGSQHLLNKSDRAVTEAIVQSISPYLGLIYTGLIT